MKNTSKDTVTIKVPKDAPHLFIAGLLELSKKHGYALNRDEDGLVIVRVERRKENERRGKVISLIERAMEKNPSLRG